MTLDPKRTDREAGIQSTHRAPDTPGVDAPAKAPRIRGYSCKEGYHEHCAESLRDCECECHDAAVENQTRRAVKGYPILLAALKRIRDKAELCDCSHDTPDCCNNVDVLCPYCIADVAITKAEAGRA